MVVVLVMSLFSFPLGLLPETQGPSAQGASLAELISLPSYSQKKEKLVHVDVSLGFIFTVHERKFVREEKPR